MAKIISVSLPDSEKDLLKWLEDKRSRNELSLSQVLRDTLVNLKKYDDIREAMDIRQLKQSNVNAKELIGKMQSFIDKKGIREDWFKFNERSDIEGNKELKNIETIVEDKSKLKKK